MGNICLKLLNGMVLETTVDSYTGKYLYSDFATGRYSDFATGRAEKDSTLNKLAKVPLIGLVAGIARVALGIVHTIGHLLAAALTCKKGHLFHVAKGGCEILRGFIEALPIAGRIFANLYNSTPIYDWVDGGRSWWMIKIYNPTKPDGLDEWMDYWIFFPRSLYIT